MAVVIASANQLQASSGALGAFPGPLTSVRPHHDPKKYSPHFMDEGPREMKQLARRCTEQGSKP